MGKMRTPKMLVTERRKAVGVIGGDRTTGRRIRMGAEMHVLWCGRNSFNVHGRFPLYG